MLIYPFALLLFNASSAYANCESVAFNAPASFDIGACIVPANMPRRTFFGGSFDMALISSTEQSLPSITPLLTLNLSFLPAYSRTFLAAAMGSSKPKVMPIGPTNKSVAGSAGVPFAAMLLRVFLTTLYSAPTSFKVFLSSAISETVSPLYSVRTTAFDLENLSDSSAICWDFFSLVIRILPPFPETSKTVFSD